VVDTGVGSCAMKSAKVERREDAVTFSSCYVAFSSFTLGDVVLI
jgi:hypothetical protein